MAAGARSRKRSWVDSRYVVVDLKLCDSIDSGISCHSGVDSRQREVVSRNATTGMPLLTCANRCVDQRFRFATNPLNPEKSFCIPIAIADYDLLPQFMSPNRDLNPFDNYTKPMFTCRVNTTPVSGVLCPHFSGAPSRSYDRKRY
jgi:hypothetical protein